MRILALRDATVSLLKVKITQTQGGQDSGQARGVRTVECSRVRCTYGGVFEGEGTAALMHGEEHEEPEDPQHGRRPVPGPGHRQVRHPAHCGPGNHGVSDTCSPSIPITYLTSVPSFVLLYYSTTLSTALPKLGYLIYTTTLLNGHLNLIRYHLTRTSTLLGFIYFYTATILLYLQHHTARILLYLYYHTT